MVDKIQLPHEPAIVESGDENREKRYIDPWWLLLAGVVVLVLLYFGLRLLHPSGVLAENLYRFLRYGVLGAWVSFGAPMLFMRLKLATPMMSD